MSKGKLYLGEIAERDGVQYKGNNLIVSPTGSGKTHFIMNTLSNKYEGNKLMLVSTTSLKDSMGNVTGTFNTQDLRRSKIDITDKSVYVMTYAEFGDIVRWRDEFTQDYSVIFCDEIHSLFDYFYINKSYKLAAAIRVLFSEHKALDLFYFTATTHLIDKFIDGEDRNLYRNVSIIDYNSHEDIKRYYNLTKREFTSVDGIEDILGSLEDFKLADKKGIIFNERIDGMVRIESLLSNKGYNSISIWSVNNEDNVMSDEQLRVRSILLSEGVIPNGYDFIIINGAMREGWNLVDPNVEIAIMNTVDETDKVQARGRIRKDISLLVERVDGDIQPIDIRIMNREKDLRVIENYLGSVIGNKEKEEISEELNIIRESDGRVVKWTTISKALLANGYEVDDSRKTVDGKKITVSVITKKEDTRKSTDSRLSNFMSKLDETGFTSENLAYLDNYMNKNKGVAFSHIKSSYKRYVIGEGWSERKFTDITYLLVNDKSLFSSKFYANYSPLYETKLTEVDILTERSKYESGAKKQLVKSIMELNAKILSEEEELLAYISSNTK